jgi:uncharacterized protein YndB with AHSA1/START domain/GNAT superfamily N-acetyltransferase
MNVRGADAAELDQLATVWFDAWRDAHEQIVPAELTRVRTWERFRARLEAALPNVRVVGAPGAPVGFSLLKGDELYQLYVSAAARGSGAAAALVADAEDRLSAAGVETAWLACAVGNERAARFYEKCGWRRARTMVSKLETPDGELPLEVWRYEKRLAGRSRTSRVIAARPDEIYGAFVDPAALVAWLPPAEMTGVMHEFDPRVGGGYRMSLFYPPTAQDVRGKTAEREDMVDVRFVELTPPHRIVEGVTFVTNDPRLSGEMTLTTTFEPVAAGTNVTMLFENLPPGVRPEDNDAGARLSLEQLAHRFEGGSEGGFEGGDDSRA